MMVVVEVAVEVLRDVNLISPNSWLVNWALKSKFVTPEPRI